MGIQRNDTKCINLCARKCENSFQQPLNISQSRRFSILHSFPTLLLEGCHHQLAFLSLDVQHRLLDSSVHDYSPDRRRLLLSKPMHSIHCLQILSALLLKTYAIVRIHLLDPQSQEPTMSLLESLDWQRPN